MKLLDSEVLLTEVWLKPATQKLHRGIEIDLPWVGTLDQAACINHSKCRNASV